MERENTVCVQNQPGKLRRPFFPVRQMNGGRLQRPAARKDRFQRAKAASLVSANRNGSAGDSTWPSQKNRLALPFLA
jgi:hypothetical protein